MDLHGTHANGCRLNQFERNRYFHGKLMTARDMEAEQTYHRTRVNTLARYVVGEGIVCGLEPSLTASGGALEVTVDPGMAIDCCGNLVIVESQTRESFPLESIQEDQGVSVYLRFDECVKETVPIPGSENACEERCTYNRVVEAVEISVEDGSPQTNPEDPGGKPQRRVVFPTPAGRTRRRGDNPGGSVGDAVECVIAGSYLETEEGTLRSCDDECDGRVFLGYFRERNGGTWARVRADEEGGEPRPFVYNNDLLYAAISQHAADFDNPHQVSLGTGDPDEGASLVVVDDESEDAEVYVRSADETVSIERLDPQWIDFSIADHTNDTTNPHQVTLGVRGAEAYEDISFFIEDDERPGRGIDLVSRDGSVALDLDGRSVDFSVASYIEDEVAERTAALESQVTAVERRKAEKALMTTTLVFAAAANRFETQRDEALTVSNFARAAVDGRLRFETDEQAAEIREIRSPPSDTEVRLEDDVYPDLFRHVLERVSEFAQAVEGDVTERSGLRLRRAVRRLESALESDGPFRLGVAQDDVCYAIDLLEPIEEEEEEEEVPDVIGMDTELARETLAEAGFEARVETTTETDDDDAEFGTVIEQDPDPGTPISDIDGRTVTIVVLEAIRLPDVVGEPVDAAVETIRELGLAVVTQAPADPSEHADAEPGTVVAQSPAPGTAVHEVSEVTLDVLEVVEVPNVVGMVASEATTVISDAGLEPVVTTISPLEISSEDYDLLIQHWFGRIIRQNPDGGTTVPVNSRVILARYRRFDGIPIDDIREIPLDIIRGIPEEDIRFLPDDLILELPEDRLIDLSDDIVLRMDPEAIAGLPVDRIEVLSPRTIETLPSETIEGLSVETIEGLSTTTIERLSPERIEDLSDTTITRLSAETIGELSIDRLGELSFEVTEELVVNDQLSGGQVAELETQGFLSAEDLASMIDDGEFSDWQLRELEEELPDDELGLVRDFTRTGEFTF